MDDYEENLIIEGVDFNHLRLLDLSRLANQAEPFYAWVELEFRKVTGRGDSLDEIVKSCTADEIKQAIKNCYIPKDPSGVPKLFDGGGVPYEHKKACFFFFSWFVRDAATQRLEPLIRQVLRHSKEHGKKLDRVELSAELLSRLIVAYRDDLHYFSWPVIREVTFSRLEGSRRAKKGSELEIFVRTALAESISYFHKTHGNYGKYRDIKILNKPLKVNSRTYDVVAQLQDYQKQNTRLIVLPVKTRETQGGGHAHLFTRDVEQANVDIRVNHPNAVIIPVIIAENWSASELDLDKVDYDAVFHFPINPNRFSGFDETEQIRLNRIVEGVLEP